MGADLDLHPEYRHIIDCADAALESVGVSSGDLRRLMAGGQQALRTKEQNGWVWRGDFPLSVAAQTVVGCCLASAFTSIYGPPTGVIGESMGEMAAYHAAGAISIQQAVVIAYRFARTLACASDQLGLRMAVIENVPDKRLRALMAEYEGQIVLRESLSLVVAALPAAFLQRLETAAAEAGGRALVSNNPCAAHEPRLADAPGILSPYVEFLQLLALKPTVLPLYSALRPGAVLRDVDSLRRNLIDTITTPLRWTETLLEISNLTKCALLVLGGNTIAYGLEKLRAEQGLPAATRIESVSKLEQLELLDALPEHRWTAPLTGSGDSLHSGCEHTGSNRGNHLLRGLATVANTLIPLNQRFPSRETVKVEFFSIRPIDDLSTSGQTAFVIEDVSDCGVVLGLSAADQQGSALASGRAWLSSRSRPWFDGAGSALPDRDYVWSLRRSENAPPALHPGDTSVFICEIDPGQIADAHLLCGGGGTSVSIATGLKLTGYAVAHVAPGFNLSGIRVLDGKRAMGEIKRAICRANLSEETVGHALLTQGDVEGFLDALPLPRRIERSVRRRLCPAIRETFSKLMKSEGSGERLLRTWRSADDHVVSRRVVVRTAIRNVVGEAPVRVVEIGIDLEDERGSSLYLCEAVAEEQGKT